ncbi:MAG: pyridine nucleotide-disulfide oxidoreductase [Chitinophagales bacterium]|nr:MAG: pyridine nucleotide-disulfide oxidoreductase [Chitinophagales bacterium]
MSIRKTKYLIIGAGPGGLQMGYFMQKQGLDYAILEKSNRAGNFFHKQPVHRTLISINKKYNYFTEEEFNERHDWNSLLSDDPNMRFTRYSDELFPHADDMCRYLQDFADRFQLNIHYNTEVKKISKKAKGPFTLTTANGITYESQVVLMALGATLPNMPEEIEGIEHTIAYGDQPLDRDFYRNKRVAVLGGGNSAFETANYLAPAAAYVHIFIDKPLKMAWDTHFVGDLRAINNTVIDMYQLKSLHAILNPRIRKIRRLPNNCLQTTHEYDYPRSSVPGTLQLTREYDIIINCTGWKWVNLQLFDKKTRPALKDCGKLPLLTETWESVNIPGLYFIGGAMKSLDEKSASGFIHGFRYNIRTLFHLLLSRYDGIPYPYREMKPFVWEKFLDYMYQRYSTTAALFQLFGFLCDLLIFNEDKSEAVIYPELPVAYARNMIPPNRHALLFTLEFGFEKYQETSLNFLGPSDPNNTRCAAFLHPVIRHFHKNKVSEFHFGDSLLARWDRPHSEGGAVISYHYDFQKWAKEKLGLQIKLPRKASSNEGPFRKWTAAEIKKWKKMQASMKAEKPRCRDGKPERVYPFSTMESHPE